MGMRSAATSFKKIMNSPLSLCSPKFLTQPQALTIE